MIPCAKLFINFILFPYCTAFVYSLAILILQYFEAYLVVGLAPSSQTVGFSLSTICWLENDTLGNVFYSLNPTCKFANFPTMLFGDYRQIVLYKESYFGHIIRPEAGWQSSKELKYFVTNHFDWSSSVDRYEITSMRQYGLWSKVSASMHAKIFICTQTEYSNPVSLINWCRTLSSYIRAPKIECKCNIYTRSKAIGPPTATRMTRRFKKFHTIFQREAKAAAKPNSVTISNSFWKSKTSETLK